MEEITLKVTQHSGLGSESWDAIQGGRVSVYLEGGGMYLWMRLGRGLRLGMRKRCPYTRRTERNSKGWGGKVQGKENKTKKRR